MTDLYYQSLVTKIASIVDVNGKSVFKTIGLFNHQVEHEVSGENEEINYLKPACFIGFDNIECSQLTQALQQVTFDVVFHIVFDTLKNPKDFKTANDMFFLNTARVMYSNMTYYDYSDAYSGFSKLQRVSETHPSDNKNIFYIQQMYKCTMKEFKARPIQNTIVVQALHLNFNILTTGIGSYSIGSSQFVY